MSNTLFNDLGRLARAPNADQREHVVNINIAIAIHICQAALGATAKLAKQDEQVIDVHVSVCIEVARACRACFHGA